MEPGCLSSSTCPWGRHRALSPQRHFLREAQLPSLLAPLSPAYPWLTLPIFFPISDKHVRDGRRAVSSCQTAKERPISHTLVRHGEAEPLVAAGELTDLRGSDANENGFAQRAQTFSIHGFRMCDPSSVRVSLKVPDMSFS